MGYGYGGGNGGGGAGARPVNRTVPAATTGALSTMARKLGSTSVFSLLSGSNANLSIGSSTGVISATAGISEGASQVAYVREAVAASHLAIEYSATLTAAVVITAPAAPSLTATAGDGQVTLSWTDGATGGATITSHKLYRGTASGSLTLIGTIMTGSPYVDTGLTNGTAYYYKLSAVNSVGEGSLSTEQSATPSAVTAPTGFYANGATNTALKAALSRVSGGTGRGKIVVKGDSTSVGMGTVIVSGTGDEVAQLTGARPYRPTATLAAELSSNGYAALDNGFVCDGRSTPYGVGLSGYDSRVSFTGADWTPNNVQSFAGGGYLNISSSSILQFTPTTSVDTFECLLFNVGGSVAFAIDGSAPATVTAPGATVVGNVVTPPSGNTGFTKVTITAASAGTHTFGAVGTAGTPLMSSVMGYNNAVKAIDIVNQASVAANSGDQATENTGGVPWYNNDELGVETPDLTIINCTVNDAGLGTATATVTANLQAIITKAKLTGDVLLVNSSPANPTFATTLSQTTLRDAVAALAVSNSVAFMDLYEYFGDWSAVASRTADGLVHPNRGMAAEIGQVYRQCIQAMAA